MHRLAILLVCLTTFVYIGDADAQYQLDVSFETTPVGGEFAPANVVAVWIEDDGGNFVKTIGRWAAVRAQHLVSWTQMSGGSGVDQDAVSGATRLSNDGVITATWDLTDSVGAPVPQGIYTIRMELADQNSVTPEENNQGTFTFEHNEIEDLQAGANGGFENVSIDYAMAVVNDLCSNNMIDPGETCDGADCPTSCAASTDECFDSVLIGSAANCDAECVLQSNGSCGDVGVDPITGGCSTGSGAPWAFALLWLCMAGMIRNRRLN